jgi:hypothetical protein
MDFPGLCFRLGIGVQSAIRDRFGEPVNYFPLPGLKEFFLIASFGRCKFKLSEDSVGVLLQATLGGVAADFRAQQISDRVFKFVLASKNVGLHVYNLKVYSCDQYKIFFHLYGNGGANWVSEYKKYVSEEAAEWTFVSGDHLKSYHLNSDDNCLSGANRISLGARSKISFQNPKPSHLHSLSGSTVGSFADQPYRRLFCRSPAR